MSKLMLRGGLSTNKGKGEISMEDNNWKLFQHHQQQFTDF